MVSVEKCNVVFIGRVFCTNVFSHCFLFFVGICNFFFPFVANRTDGCTTSTTWAIDNWAMDEPNGGSQGASSETVAAILFQNVSVGQMDFFVGELFDEYEGNKRPAIYECCGCESAPSGAPSSMSQP